MSSVSASYRPSHSHWSVVCGGDSPADQVTIVSAEAFQVSSSPARFYEEYMFALKYPHALQLFRLTQFAFGQIVPKEMATDLIGSGKLSADRPHAATALCDQMQGSL
jgi:hypothetical protein